jgi:filamentous hemagglutinin
MNVLIGAVSGVGAAAITKEGLSQAADQMRQLMIEDSKKFVGATDGVTTLSNDSGKSAGVRGDAFKLGGTRVDLDLLCGTSNDRCKTSENGSLLLDEKQHVQFNPDAAGMSLNKFLETSEEGKKMSGLTGGIQGWKGTLFGIPYAPGSWPDKLIEAFSGTHDMVGGKLSGLYDEQGNTTRGRSTTEVFLNNRWSEIAILPSAPFAAAANFSPELWSAISIILKAAK